jgi:hypothetical protein
VFATLEERDWLLINETKRPHLIAAPHGEDSVEDRVAASAKNAAAENEFQVNVGTGLAEFSPMENFFLFLKAVQIEKSKVKIAEKNYH